MIGSFGCPCARCKGNGTISKVLKSKLCALERLLGVEMVVTMGYRCKNMAASVGMPDREMAHTNMKDGEGVALAVDFFPRNSEMYGDKNGRRWGNRRFDFIEVVRPFFDKVWICVDEDVRKWSIHGEIKSDDSVDTYAKYGGVDGNDN